MKQQALNIGFISTRFAGTDGVSLETQKWADVLTEMGHTCYYFAGECDRPAGRSLVVPEAFFGHPEVSHYHQRFFGQTTRTAEDTAWIHHWRAQFRSRLDQFVREFSLDVLIPQNIFAIPLQLPLALALTELIAETGLPTIAHHHDFAWERKRFLVNAVSDYLGMAFPPDLPTIQHVVINSQAYRQLAHRRGVGAVIVPNVMNYEAPPPPVDAYAADVREALGLEADEYLILQPTRVIQRKGIEHAVELVRRLDLKARLVISHASGDEGDDYEQRVRAYAGRLGVNTLFCADLFGETRGTTADGRKIYSLADAYPHADLVTYPSLIEGFGNAFLEAVYFRRPLVVNNYPVYATDVRPLGFQVVEFDEYVTDETVEQARRVLQDATLAAEMCARNYALAKRYFSYTVLRRKLRILLENSKA